MNLRFLVGLIFLALFPALLSGCSDSVGPDNGNGPPQNQAVPQDDLIFIRSAPDAPPLADTVVSFWAVRGENREVEIRYAPTSRYGEGAECLVFEVPGNALLRYPDGTTFEDGDSVRITIRVVDLEKFYFEFEPSGLTFDPDHPAELEVSYTYADRDYDGDGDLDADDDRIEEEFGFWRQERPGDPWYEVMTIKLDDLEKADAELTGFTRYALASN